MDGESIRAGIWRRPPRLTAKRLTAGLVIALIVLGWATSSTGLFTVDEYFYVRSAESMAEEGSLTFRQFEVDGAPALDMNFARPTSEAGRLTPQYPSGYALVAAPFFAILGIKGLTLLNAIAAAASLWLTFGITLAIYRNENSALLAVVILATATFWSSYAFAVWPHMVALAIVLAALDRMLAAGNGETNAVIAAGLIVGFGQTVRIDMIVLAPVVIFWLRLFCDGPTRRDALRFVLALAPGLAFAAWLNWEKSGVLNPFIYENDVAANQPSDFLPLAIAAGALMIAIMMFDVRRLNKWPHGSKPLVTMALLVCATGLLTSPWTAMFKGYWVSLVDAQAYEHLDRQIGIVRNEFGWLNFYGFSKKALAESLPFLPLMALPIIRFFRGAMTRGEGLLLAVAGAFATLYSFNQTDSGLGLNARFLLPLLPIASIIAAVELRGLQQESRIPALTLAKVGALGAGFFLVFRLITSDEGRWSTPFDLYPQLAIAFLLLVVLGWRVRWPSAPSAQIACALAAVSIGAGAAISIDDFVRDQSYRAYVARKAAFFRAALPAESFVLTTRPSAFIEAATRGVAIAYPGLNPPERERTAVVAHQRAGWCVFAEGDGARLRLKRDLGLSALRVPDIDESLVAAAGNPADCVARLRDQALLAAKSY